MDESEKDRVWQYTLHEDLLFNERQNFFLLAQSLLAVAYASGLDADEANVARSIAVIALILSGAWMMVAVRQLKLAALVQEEAREALPEYERVLAKRPPGIRSRYIVGYFVPFLLLAMWVALLLVAFI